MNQHQKILFVRYFFLHSGTEIRRAASVFKYEARSWEFAAILRELHGTLNW